MRVLRVSAAPPPSPSVSTLHGARAGGKAKQRNVAVRLMMYVSECFNLSHVKRVLKINKNNWDHVKGVAREKAAYDLTIAVKTVKDDTQYA